MTCHLLPADSTVYQESSQAEREGNGLRAVMIKEKEFRTREGERHERRSRVEGQEGTESHGTEEGRYRKKGRVLVREHVCLTGL